MRGAMDPGGACSQGAGELEGEDRTSTHKDGRKRTGGFGVGRSDLGAGDGERLSSRKRQGCRGRTRGWRAKGTKLRRTNHGDEPGERQEQ